MVDDLQHRRDLVRRGPGGAALAVHIEHVAADRHRRVPAIVDEIVPVLVAELGDVLAERAQEVLGVLRRQIALGERVAQRHAGGVVTVVTQQTSLQAIEMRELVGGLHLRVVGDIVGDADELVERQDRPAVRRRNHPRGHGEILVPRALARSMLRSVQTHDPDTFA